MPTIKSSQHKLISTTGLLILALCLSVTTASAETREFAGVVLEEKIVTAAGDELLLNGAGLRERFWVDVYVGSLYLPFVSNDIAKIYSNTGAYRIQLDFLYNSVSRDNLLQAWADGFEKNQTADTLQALQGELTSLYALFEGDAVRGDQYVFDYNPGTGVSIMINGESVGRIEGTLFKDALLDIWLGNEPADISLKRGMIGLD